MNYKPLIRINGVDQKDVDSISIIIDDMYPTAIIRFKDKPKVKVRVARVAHFDAKIRFYCETVK